MNMIQSAKDQIAELTRKAYAAAAAEGYYDSLGHIIHSSVYPCRSPRHSAVPYDGGLRKKPVAYRLPMVATITALMVCMRFSASSNTLLFGERNTSSVTSRIS